MKNTPFVFALIFVFTTKLFAQNASDKLAGIWLTPDKDGKIEIYKKGNEFCGKLVWMKEPNGPDGKPKLDVKNPDAKLRTQTFEGMVLLTGFVYDGDNVWKNGKIYDGRSGKFYSCKLTLSDSGKLLNVRGYVGFSLLGQTSVWTRVR